MITLEERFWELFEKMPKDQQVIVAYAIENPQFGQKLLVTLQKRKGKENEDQCTCRT